MKKNFFSIFFIAVLCLSNSYASFERGYADLVDKLLPSVVVNFIEI